MNPSPSARSGARSALSLALAASAALPAAGCTTDAEPGSQAADLARVQHFDIAAPSLEGNLLGDPAERSIWVYLPPGYFETDEPLPTVYFLPNQGDSTIHNTEMPREIDPAFDTAEPLIIVSVSGRNRYDGSFWLDSPVTGNWGEFIASDVVDFVDAHFRTIQDAHARGIAGHAMGGYGALDIALRHPDVFGSAFAFAPWVLAAAGPDEGLTYPPERIGTTVEIIESVEGRSPEKTLALYDPIPTAVGTPRTGIDIAYGMAFSPLADPPFFSYPFHRVDGRIVRDDAVWAAWTRGPGDTSGNPAADAPTWSRLDAIGIDCSSNAEHEWFVNGCEYLDNQLTEAGIEHDFWPDDGVFGDHIPTRVVLDMIPFFDEHLARSPEET